MARLPYPPRPGQEALVRAVQDVQEAGGHLILEAGTGTGKTIAVATASLASRRRDGRRLVYATRANSQQQQVLLEHAALRRAGEDPGLVVPFMGRRHYCPLLKQDARFRDGTPDELGRLCRAAKAKAREAEAAGRDVDGACPYYRRLIKDGPQPVEALLRAGVASVAGLADQVAAAGSCPYEALKELLPTADVVIVPYVFVVDHRLRGRLLEWMGAGPDALHLVVDEAHNLPAAARDHHSLRLTLATLRRAQREAEECKDPVLAGQLQCTTLLDALADAIGRLVGEFVVEPDGADEPDGLLPPDALAECLMVKLGTTTPVLARGARDLESWAQVVREARRAQGRLPRSYLGAVGQFLGFWLGERDAPYVHLAIGGKLAALEAYLLDPAAVLGWLDEFWSTVHMSGTLRPLAGHQRVCGIGDARKLEIPSPFDPARLRIYAVEGLHRRFEALRQDPSIVQRQQEAARRLLLRWTGRVGVFFPSHAMLEDYLEEGFLHGIDASVHRELQGMDGAQAARLVEDFRTDGAARALLLGVLGGRLAEGIDFPGDAMEHLLIMGVPYPRPSARLQALVQHYDSRLGTGWQVAVHEPTGRMLRQAIGRLIRGPDDTGTAVVLDERLARFRSLLPAMAMVRDVEDATDTPMPPAGGFTVASRLAVRADATPTATAPPAGAAAEPALPAQPNRHGGPGEPSRRDV